MGKPRLIILIRHGQSEGNKNRDIHQTVPDHRVKLTSEGWNQAHDAGRRLREMLRADDTIQFFTSPYRRTRETTEGILQTLTSDEAEPSPFKRNNIKVYEEPRLREQDFGNFQPCSAEMERMWQERADYGHFFYRIPDGESAADAYDRVSGFNESLWRQFGDDDFPSVCVLVTHGLMSRVFLMKWYHFSVEYFEDLRNVNHCEFLIMRKQSDSGKYKLESKLRTWSDLRRERAAVQKQKDDEAAREALEADPKAKAKEANGKETKDKDAAKLEKALTGLSAFSSTNLTTRRWGGCPNGCNHDKSFKIRAGFADLIKRDGTNVYENDTGSARTKPAAAHTHTHASHAKSRAPTPPPLSRRGTGNRRFQAVGYSDDDDDGEVDDDNRASTPGSTGSTGSTGDDKPQQTAQAPAAETVAAATAHGSGLAPANIDVKRAREEVVSSPDATPSFITPEDRLRGMGSPPVAPKAFLHIGRDFGGTYSGHTSDADSSEDDRVRHRMARLKLGLADDARAHAHAHAHAQPHSHGHARSETRSSLAKSVTAASRMGSDAEDDGDLDVAASPNVTSPVTGSGVGVGVGVGAGASTTSLAGQARRKRAKNMANRLGDAPHCSECEHRDSGLCADELDMDDALRERDDNDNAGDNEADDDDDQTDIDHDLTAADKAERGVRESVY